MADYRACRSEQGEKGRGRGRGGINQLKVRSEYGEAQLLKGLQVRSIFYVSHELGLKRRLEDLAEREGEKGRKRKRTCLPFLQPHLSEPLTRLREVDVVQSEEYGAENLVERLDVKLKKSAKRKGTKEKRCSAFLPQDDAFS